MPGELHRGERGREAWATAAGEPRRHERGCEAGATAAGRAAPARVQRGPGERVWYNVKRNSITHIWCSSPSQFLVSSGGLAVTASGLVRFIIGILEYVS